MTKGMIFFEDYFNYMDDMTPEQFYQFMGLIRDLRYRGIDTDANEIEDKIVRLAWRSVRHSVAKSKKNSDNYESNKNKQQTKNEDMYVGEFKIQGDKVVLDTTGVEVPVVSIAEDKAEEVERRPQAVEVKMSKVMPPEHDEDILIQWAKSVKKNDSEQYFLDTYSKFFDDVGKAKRYVSNYFKQYKVSWLI